MPTGIAASKTTAMTMSGPFHEPVASWSRPMLTSRGATLIESLDGDLDADAESAWGAEIERRLARIDAGQGTQLSVEEAVARLHTAARGS